MMMNHRSQQQRQQQQQQQQRHNEFRHSLIAGGCSGVVSTFALYPLEFVRVQLQQQSSSAATERSTIQILKEAIPRPTILYTGLSLPLAAQTVYKAVVFSVTTGTEQWILQCRQQRQRRPQEGQRRPERPDDNDDEAGITTTLTRMDRFYSGCVGGAVNAALFVTPVEFVRNQLILQAHQPPPPQHHQSHVVTTGNHHRPSSRRSLRDVVRYQVQHGGGIHTLWRGVGWTVARDAIGCGAFFYTVHYLQESLAQDPRTMTTLSPPVRTIISGAMAGVAFWVVALPMDTVKTWIQSADPRQPNENVARTELVNIYQTSGSWGVVQRLLRGWQVAYTRAMPAAALTMITYNSVYQLLEDKKDTSSSLAAKNEAPL